MWVPLVQDGRHARSCAAAAVGSLLFLLLLFEVPHESVELPHAETSNISERDAVVRSDRYL